ncbi:MAG TPA: glycoside hydrolase family 2 TIM barrel-domain containing protein, partial [Candidatus Hydrogenedentes bacterium]|nr:glycoside hydrolase family 2 TIM barrel-domain containing protein [Candidatus Hydrogenedentota bacterium]
MQAKIALTAMILSLLLVPMAAATPRAVVSLDGAWRMVKVESLDVPPPTDGWVEFEVPGTLRGHDYERAWFRRAFEVPADWAGRRVVVRFGGVKYASRVMVNGDRVGECFNGYDAFEVDATAAIRPGETNELSVGVHDWTGVFDEGERIDVRAATNRSELRALPRDRVLAPIGGYVDLYGIWDSVELEAMPAAHLDDLSFRPSIRGNRAEIDVAVVNDSTDALAADVQARVYAYDGSPRESSGVWAVTGEPVGVASVPVGTVAAGMNSRVTLTLSEPQVDLWWPHDPKLYILEVRLNDGADVLRERVGFRELWCEGGDFVFNGRRVHLLASSWWPPSTPPRRDEVEARLRGIKAMNAFCFRTHTQPWHRLWYEVADELGVMMIPEAAIWNDDSVYRLGDAVFWSNYADHVRAMVRHLRNHASVVMWSLENEFQGGLAKDGSPAEDALAQLGRLVKEFDPTRPITFESDGDPGGVADVIGLHYPNEYPERRCWPNDAYWMDEPSTTWRGNMFWHDDTFFWNREKPLYIGEFLWAPACDPAPDTIFFGDQAYADFRAYHDRAKAESWRMQILAYRHYGVSGISPWTVREHGDLDETNPCWRAQRDLYRPVAAFLRESDARFLSEERLARTLWVFNDSLRDWPETQLSWSLESERGTLSRDRQTLDLASGAQREIPLTIPLPSVDVRTTLRIEIGLAAGEEALFSETWPIEVFPRRVGWTLPGVTLYVHDPRRALEEAWRKAGVAFVRIDALDAWPGDGVLILGPGALETPAAAGDVPVIGAVNAAGAALYERVGAGGRVLAIGQAPAAGAWLPARATPQQSTMAFVQEPGHPVLEGLSDADLRWWRGDNMVTVHEYQRPVGGPGHALVVTGSAQGIAHAP